MTGTSGFVECFQSFLLNVVRFGWWLMGLDFRNRGGKNRQRRAFAAVLVILNPLRFKLLDLGILQKIGECRGNVVCSIFGMQIPFNPLFESGCCKVGAPDNR